MLNKLLFNNRNKDNTNKKKIICIFISLLIKFIKNNKQMIKDFIY